MTIDSTTIKNVISNLEIAEGMIEDINASLKSARSGLYSNIAVDVKDIKINNDCVKELNLARQIHDAFVSVLGDEDNSISQDDSMNLDESFDDNDIIFSKGNKKGFNADKIATLLGGTSTTFSNEEILSLGKVPLNKAFLNNPEDYRKKVNDKKAKNELQNKLMEYGLSKEDIERITRGEIDDKILEQRIGEVQKEIYDEYCNGNSARYEKLVTATLFHNLYFSRSELTDKKNEIETSIDEMEKGKSTIKRERQLYEKAINGAKFDSKNQVYVYNDNGNVKIFDKVSFEMLSEMRDSVISNEEAYDAQIELLNSELEDINTKLNDPTIKDFTYRSVAEIDERINEITTSQQEKTDEEKKVLESEKNELLYIKAAIEKNIEFALKNDKYRFQSDFDEKSGFNASKAQEITYFDNGGNIVVDLFGIEDGKYKFMDSDEYRGALLSRMINGDARIIPDFQGNAFNVWGQKRQEYYFYGNERKLVFSEYQDWIDASTKENESEPTVITPAEIKIFNYICNTEGYEAGYKYLKEREIEFDKRYIEIKTAKDSKNAHNNGWLGAVSLFTAIPEAIMNTGKIITRKNSGQQLHLGDSYSTSNTWNATISSDMHKYNDILGYVYDTLYGTDRMLLSAVTSYATGGAGTVSSIATNGVMYGLPTFTNTVHTSKTKNIDDDRAIRYALVCATARTLATSYTITKATGLESTFNNMLTNGNVMSKIGNLVSKSSILSKNPVLSQNLLLAGYCMFTQGTVAGTTAVVDQTLTSVADILINGDMSDASIRFKNYKKLHEDCSDFEAYMYVAGDNMSKSFSAYISAFGPGAILGGIKASSIISHQKTLPQNINFKEAFKDDTKAMEEGTVGGGNSPNGGGPSGGPHASNNPSSGGGPFSKTNSNKSGETIEDYLNSLEPSKRIILLDKVLEDKSLDAGTREYLINLRAKESINNAPLLSSSETNSDSSMGHFEEQIQMSVDENGISVPQTTKVWISEPGNSSNVGSIQQTNVNVGLNTDSSSSNANPNLTDTFGVKVPVESLIDGKPVDSFVVIDEKGGSNNFVLPFAPTFSDLSTMGNTNLFSKLQTTGQLTKIDWCKLTGAFTQKQLESIKTVEEIEANVVNSGNKITLRDFSNLYKQARLPLNLQEKIRNDFEKNGLITEKYVSDSIVDTTDTGNKQELGGLDHVVTEIASDNYIKRNNNSNDRKISFIEDIPIVPEIPIPETFKIDEAVLVRSAEFLPTNDGVVETPIHAGATSNGDETLKINGEYKGSETLNRHTSHWALNGLVEGGFAGAGDWQGNSIFIIEPYKYHEDSSFKGGFAGDVYFDNDVTLSDEAVILVTEDYYNANQDKIADLKNNVVVFDGDPTKAIKTVINNKGYAYIDPKKLPSDYDGDARKWADSFNEYVREAKGKTISKYAIDGGLHYYSPDNIYEECANKVEATLEYLRNKKVDVSNGVTLSISEAETILGLDVNVLQTAANKSDYDTTRLKTINENKFLPSSLATLMNRYGIHYDQSTNTFSVLSYDDYIKNYNNLTEESEEVKEAAKILNERILSEKSERESNQANRSQYIKSLKESLEDINRVKKSIADNREYLESFGIKSDDSTAITIPEYLKMRFTKKRVLKFGEYYDQKSNKIIFPAIDDIKGIKTDLDRSTMVELQKTISNIDNIDATDPSEVDSYVLINLLDSNEEDVLEFIKGLDTDSQNRQISNLEQILHRNDVIGVYKRSLESLLQQLKSIVSESISNNGIKASSTSDSSNSLDLYNADTMPLSEIPKRQTAIEKILNGEKLNEHGIKYVAPSSASVERIKSPDEILETYLKEGMDKYSYFDLKSTLDESDKIFYIRGQSEKLKQYLELASTKEQQKVLSEILLNGGYNGFGFDSKLCSHNNRNVELARRLSMATMYLANPETFIGLAENGVNMFHGTNSSILESVLESGLNSVDTIEQSGKTVSTGEYGTLNSGTFDMHSSIRGRNFISFTDIFDLAYGYARSKEDGSFKVIIGTTTENISNSRTVSISGGLTEIGVKDNLPIDKIKTILVPGDKVEYVKKLIGDKDIKVLSLDGYDKKPFHYYDEFLPLPSSRFDEFAKYVKDRNMAIKNTSNDDVEVQSSPTGNEKIQTTDDNIASFDSDLQVIDVSKIDTERENKSGKILKESDNTVGLTEKNLAQLPDNVKNLVISKLVEQGYTTEQSINLLNEKFANFESETELYENVKTIFESDLYIDIIQLLGDGYTLDEIVADGQASQEKVARFKAILDENKLDIDSIIAINKYTIGSNMILAVKRGVEKSKILNNIHSEFNSRLTEYKFPQEQISQIGEYIDSLDYSKPLHENYALVKDFLSKYNISSKYVAAVQSTVRNLNSYYHLDETIINLDKALHQKLSTPMILYRAVDSTYTKNIYGQDLKTLIGQKINTNGYLSTSPLYDSSFAKYDNYDIVYEIYAPAGTEGVLVAPYSCYGKTENEVLLNTASLIITDVVENSVDKNGKVKTVIKAILVNDNVSSLNSNISVIDVSKIDTERENKSILARGVDPNIMNMSYKGYDFVYKTSNDVENAIQQIVNENKNGKILLELDSTIGLTSENLAKLPNNVKIRVLGNYGTENFKGFASNDSGISSLQHATYSISEMQDIMKAINKFESGINPIWNDELKARYAYDYMVNNIRYRDSGQDDQIGGNANRPAHYDGLTNLIVKKSTCQGFAHTYRELLTRMGITCYEISGKMVGGHSQHAFNVVCINGKTIIVDTTRNKFADFYDDVINNPQLVSILPHNYDTIIDSYKSEIERLEKKYPDSGFGVENIDQYIFYSHRELKEALTPTILVNLNKSVSSIKKIMDKNIKKFNRGRISENEVFNGLNSSKTERAQTLSKWAKTDAIDKINKFFNGEIDLSKTKDSNIVILESDEFDALGFDKGTVGINDNNINIIRIPKSVMFNLAYNRIMHELIHNTSRNNRENYDISGFDITQYTITKDNKGKQVLEVIDRKYEGFNEAVTELFSSLILPELSNSEYTTDYQLAVNSLKKILDLNIDGFDLETLKKQYLLNDIAPLREAIDKVAGDGFFENELIPSFDKGISPHSLVKLDSFVYKYGNEILDEAINKLVGIVNKGHSEVIKEAESIIPPISSIINKAQNTVNHLEIVPAIEEDISISEIDSKLDNLLKNDEFIKATVDEQKRMISEICDYDKLPEDSKLLVFMYLLDVSASKQGLTVNDLSKLKTDTSISQEVKEKSLKLAQDLYDKAFDNEKRITEIMKSFEDDDCILMGTEKKLKGIDRISEKIISISNKEDINLDEASKKVKDTLRYTLIIDNDNYTAKALEVLTKFKMEGYEIIKANNSWDDDTYKGINTFIKTTDGTIFELQIHTPESFTVKDIETHLYYEIERNMNVDERDKALASEIQKIYTGMISIPKDILGFNFISALNNVTPTPSKSFTEKLSNFFFTQDNKSVMKSALKKGIKGFSIIYDKDKIENVINVLKSLDLSYLDKSIIEKYASNDGFDFAAFLNHVILYDLLVDQNDYEKLKELFDYKKIIYNPSEELNEIFRTVNTINVTIDNYGINTLNGSNNDLYNYYSFLIHLLSRDYQFRKDNKGDLIKVVNKVCEIAKKIVDAKYQSTINYSGINISLYGDDYQKLETAVKKLGMIIDMLPIPFKNVLTKINGIKLVDSPDPGNLNALYYLPNEFNNPNTKNFSAAGLFSMKNNNISLFKYFFEQHDLDNLLEVLSHEIGHFLDLWIGNLLTNNLNNNYFTSIFNKWSLAKQKDSVIVSSYGENNLQEDLAELCGFYSVALSGYKDMKKIFNRFPERLKILESLFVLSEDKTDFNTYPFFKRLEMLKIYEDISDSDLIYRILGKDYINNLYASPSDTKIQFINMMENMGVSNKYISTLINKDFLNNFTVDYKNISFSQIIEMIKRYETDDNYDIIYKLLGNNYINNLYGFPVEAKIDFIQYMVNKGVSPRVISSFMNKGFLNSFKTDNILHLLNNYKNTSYYSPMIFSLFNQMKSINRNAVDEIKKIKPLTPKDDEYMWDLINSIIVDGNSSMASIYYIIVHNKGVSDEFYNDMLRIIINNSE